MKSNLINRSIVLLLFAATSLIPKAALANVWAAGNNSFNSAPLLTASSGVSNTTNMENYDTELNEPGHRLNGAQGAGKTAWWRWTAPDNGFVCIHTLLTKDNQVSQPVGSLAMAVYTGNNLSSLTRVAANEEYWLIREGLYVGHSSVAFYALKGTTYRIAVDGRLPGSVGPTQKNVVIQLRQIANRSLSRHVVWGVTSDPAYRGSLTLRQTGASSFTAVFIAGRRTFRFRGQYDIEGYFKNSFTLPTPAGALPVPPLHLELDGVGSAWIRLHDSQGSVHGGPFPEVSSFSSANPNPVAGYFTAATSNGYATANVGANGRTRGSVRAPDGTALTYSAPLTATLSPSQFYLMSHRLLRRGSGYWHLYSSIQDNGTADDWFSVSNHSRHFRAASSGATFLPGGMNQAFSVFGGTYVRPVSGSRPFGFLNPAGNGRLILSNGDFAVQHLENLVWGANNRITVSNSPNRTSIRFNQRTGIIGGSLRRPGEATRVLRGVIRRYLGGVQVGGQVTGPTRISTMNITTPL